ncbi:hypothetical protein Tco_0686950 [Tanacetum coccineum]
MAVPKESSQTFSWQDDVKEIWQPSRQGKLGERVSYGTNIQNTSSSSLSSDNVAFLSQAKAKASSSKHKPSHNSGSYSSYTTSSSKATPLPILAY